MQAGKETMRGLVYRDEVGYTSQRYFRTKCGHDPPSRHSIRECHKKFMETASVLNKKDVSLLAKGMSRGYGTRSTKFPTQAMCNDVHSYRLQTVEVTTDIYTPDTAPALVPICLQSPMDGQSFKDTFVKTCNTPCLNIYNNIIAYIQHYQEVILVIFTYNTITFGMGCQKLRRQPYKIKGE